jgi:hypothetical protein
MENINFNLHATNLLVLLNNSFDIEYNPSVENEIINYIENTLIKVCELAINNK